MTWDSCWLLQLLLVASSRRKASAGSRTACKVDDTQLEFSESMRRTQDAVARTTACGCLSRWFCCCVSGGAAESSHDKYAVDMLATEIDSLKRALREV